MGVWAHGYTRRRAQKVIATMLHGKSIADNHLGILFSPTAHRLTDKPLG